MGFFHRYFEYAPLLLPRQIKYLPGLGIDAEPTPRAYEFFVFDEMLQKPSIRRLVNFHMLIERQQRRDVKMVANGLYWLRHSSPPSPVEPAAPR